MFHGCFYQPNVDVFLVLPTYEALITEPIIMYCKCLRRRWAPWKLGFECQHFPGMVASAVMPKRHDNITECCPLN